MESSIVDFVEEDQDMGEIIDLAEVGGDDIPKHPDHAGQVLDNIHLHEEHLNLGVVPIDKGYKRPRIP